MEESVASTMRQGDHLQQVMSRPDATGAVPSPAAQPGEQWGEDGSQTMIIGTNPGAVDPPPSGLEQPVAR